MPRILIVIQTVLYLQSMAAWQPIMFTLPTFLRRQRRPAPEVRQPEPEVVAVETMDRRQSPRRGGPPVEVLLDDGLTPKPIAGWVRNRAVGGLGISCAQALAVGTVLKVRATVAPSSSLWTELAVRNCTPWLTGWMLHCEYVGAPAEEARLLFR